MSEWIIIVRILQFVAAVLTMMSRSSPLLPSDSLDRRQMSVVGDSTNFTANITDNLLFNDTKGEFYEKLCNPNGASLRGFHRFPSFRVSNRYCKQDKR